MIQIQKVLTTTTTTTTTPTRFPPRSDKVKKMIRRGIPPEWRGNAWFLCWWIRKTK